MRRWEKRRERERVGDVYIRRKKWHRGVELVSLGQMCVYVGGFGRVEVGMCVSKKVGR